jgi:opacity protein-like surface antigen
MSIHRAAVAAVLVTGLAFAMGAPAAAGQFGVSLEGGYFGMTNANKSAKAIFGGSSGGFTGGGSIRYVFMRSAFVGVGAHYFTRDGQRVFVADPTSTPFRLGHPLTIREIPVYGMVGWRFLADSHLVPYVAFGVGATSLSEKSIVGGIEDPPSQSQSKFSSHFIAGVEFGRSVVRFGAEVMYTTVPDSIGLGGVSKIYGEKDVGGFTVVGKIVVVP